MRARLSFVGPFPINQTIVHRKARLKAALPSGLRIASSPWRSNCRALSRFRPPVCLMPTPSRSRSRSLPRVPTSLSWGSDWPHVATYGPMPNLSSLDLLADWAPWQPLPGMCELPQKCSASLLSPSDGRCLADSTVKGVFSADHGMYAGLIRRLKVRARLADR